MVHPRTAAEEKAMYNLAAQILYIVYYASGGAYFAKNLSNKTKRNFFAINFIAAFIVTLSYLYLLYGVFNEFIVLDVIQYAKFVPLTGIYLYIFLYSPGLIIIYQDKIECTLSYISACETNFQKINFRCQNRHSSGELVRNNDSPTNDILFRKQNILMFPIIMYIIISSVGSFSYMYPIIRYALFISSERSSNIEDHNTVPLPFYNCAQSNLSYYFLIQSLLFLWSLSVRGWLARSSYFYYY